MYKNIVVNTKFSCYSEHLLRYITVMGEDVDKMRNLIYFMCVALRGSGRRVRRGPGEARTATLEAPMPKYEQQQTELTPEQRYLAQVLKRAGLQHGS